jgi:ribosomal protein S28E/S33
LSYCRPANLWFVLLSALCTVPRLTPVAPATWVVPLLFVLAVTAAKQALEDYRRHRADGRVNARSARVRCVKGGDCHADMGGEGIQRITCGDVRVGDVLMVHPTEEVRTLTACTLARGPFRRKRLLLRPRHPVGRCGCQQDHLNGSRFQGTSAC